MQRPTLKVAVVMQRTRAPNAWEDWGFRVLEVLPDEGVFGTEMRVLHDDGRLSRWLHPGFELALFADECKGYVLNLTSGNPVWFVPWRVDDSDPSLARPEAVSVSYIEADRRLSAEEHVDNVPLAPELVDWLQAFADEHFKPDEKRKHRAQSFRSAGEREEEAQRLQATPATPAPGAG